MKHKHSKSRLSKRIKTISILLAVMLILTLTIPASSALTATDSTKQEVVYINLKSDGSVKNIYVVNSFELDENGKIIDYGNYSQLRNMTTNDKIKFENEKVTIDTNAQKLYYEGKLNNDVIPWDFSIHYYIDGKEYSAKEIAGKSGNFQLNISVKQNPNCNSTFFDHYSLQASVTLDTDFCKNIKSDNATVANVGRNCQLTYMILPGNETDITVTADVTDFEMDGISINGIPLSLSLDLDSKTDELSDEINEITDAVEELNDGAVELRDGASELKDGADDLKDGAGKTDDGAKDLCSGAKNLKKGTSDLKKGAKELNKGTKDLLAGSKSLSKGTSNLKKGANDLSSGVKDATDGALDLYKGAKALSLGLSSANEGASFLYSGLSDLSSNSEDLRKGAYEIFTQLTYTAQIQINQSLTAQGLPTVTLTPETYDEVLNELLNQLSNSTGTQTEESASVENSTQADPTQDIINLKSQLDNYQLFYNGLVQYTQGADSATGGSLELETALSQLLIGSQQLEKGSKELYDGLSKLQDGSADLLDGTITLNEGAIDLKDGVIKLKDGSMSVLNGTAKLNDGAITLFDGIVTLKDGTAQLASGTIEMYDGTVELHDGTIELADGTFEFKDKTSDLDSTFKDKINEAIEDVIGTDFDVVSFVSDKNTNVESVQFVIKTNSISIDEEEDITEEEPQEMNLWQKILNLFGLYNEE